MKLIKSIKILALCSSLTAILPACEKRETAVPPAVVTFAGRTGGTYTVSSPTSIFKIPVGISTPVGVDKTITVKVVSPTGAVEGTHYTLPKKQVIIPAGKVVDSLEVKAAYDLYRTGRRDDLIFMFTETDTEVSQYNNQYKLVVRGS